MQELRDERYISLATFRKNGKAVETPVWFGESQGRLYVFTLRESGKIKRLRNSSRARVAACDMRGRVHGAWRDASARILDDPATIARAHAALRDKYGMVMSISDVLSRLSGRYRRRLWLEIDLATP